MFAFMLKMSLGKDIFAGHGILGWLVFSPSFQQFKDTFLLCMSYKVYNENSVVIQIIVNFFSCFLDFLFNLIF